MYYVVTQKQHGNAAVDILARCRTARGALRRLDAEVADYHRNYGYNTIFPARPWVQQHGDEPTRHEPDAVVTVYELQSRRARGE